MKFEKYGNPVQDDYDGSLPSNAKNLLFGVNYVPEKNIIWSTFIADEKLNISTGANIPRKLFRTRMDFNF